MCLFCVSKQGARNKLYHSYGSETVLYDVAMVSTWYFATAKKGTIYNTMVNSILCNGPRVVIKYQYRFNNFFFLMHWFVDVEVRELMYMYGEMAFGNCLHSARPFCETIATLVCLI